MSGPRFSFIVTTIIEIVLFWAIMVMIISLFIDTTVTTRVNESQRILNELAENVMEAPSLTVAKGVFSAEKLAEFDGTVFEPVRPCKYGSRYKISRLGENGELGKSWEFGYPKWNGITQADYVRSEKSADYNVWVKDGDIVAPTRLTVTIMDAEFARFTCAVERAMANGTYEIIWGCGPTFEEHATCGVGNEKDASGQVSAICITQKEGPPICRRSSVAIKGLTDNGIITDTAPVPGISRLRLVRTQVGDSPRKAEVRIEVLEAFPGIPVQ